MQSAPLQVKVARTGDVTTVTLTGDADFAAADLLASSLLPVTASKPAHVIFDLSNLAFISSLAIGQLVTLRRSVATAGGRVTLAAPQELVLKALKHTHVASMFEIVAEMPGRASA